MLPGVPLLVRTDVRVGRGIDEDATVAMLNQPGIAKRLRFHAQRDDREWRVVLPPGLEQPPRTRQVERVGEDDEADAGWRRGKGHSCRLILDPADELHS